MNSNTHAQPCNRTEADVFAINALADNPSIFCSCGYHAMTHDVLTETGEPRRYGPKPIMGVGGLTS